MPTEAKHGVNRVAGPPDRANRDATDQAAFWTPQVTLDGGSNYFNTLTGGQNAVFLHWQKRLRGPTF